MKTIQVLNENGKLAGTMSVDCKPAKKVNKPYFNGSFELVIPAGWSEKQLKMWLKSSEGKLAVEANKAEKQAAKQAQCEVSEVSPVILTIITMKKEITPALNAKIAEQALEEYQKKGCKTKKEFDAIFNKLIKKYGFTVKHYNSVMNDLGCDEF